MIREPAAIDAPPPACPRDLCLHGECYCEPSSDAAARRRTALQALGCLAAGAAIAGVVLPLVPTTPFVLVAAWAFARSSPRLDAWLRNHPRLGPPLDAWERRRAIPARAKAVAVATLPVSWIGLHLAGSTLPVLIVAGATLVAVASWILTRPS